MNANKQEHKREINTLKLSYYKTTLLIPNYTDHQSFHKHKRC